MRRAIVVLSGVLAFGVVSAVPAVADDDARFHRTTPRGSLVETRDVLVIGIPGGRAWGVESELRPLPDPGVTLVVRLTVTDPLVREAFVRVAYYAVSPARSRQLAVSDSAPVAYGERALVAIALDPPPGAVAYRVRMLARLRDPGARSADDAVRAALRPPFADAGDRGPRYSRLLP